MPEDLSLAPATATATVHPVDAATSRMVHEQLASGRPDVGLLWELCLRVEYERPALVDGLAAWLGPPAGLRVLDAACGSGFPALGLIRRGYAVTCSDGSPQMLERFRRNAAAAAVAVRPQLRRWEELWRHHAAAFDVVLCRGSSLIYAGTWDREEQPSRAVLERSVESLVRCVRPGGRLYVDTTRAEDLAAPSAGSRASWSWPTAPGSSSRSGSRPTSTAGPAPGPRWCARPRGCAASAGGPTTFPMPSWSSCSAGPGSVGSARSRSPASATRSSPASQTRQAVAGRPADLRGDRRDLLHQGQQVGVGQHQQPHRGGRGHRGQARVAEAGPQSRAASSPKKSPGPRSARQRPVAPTTAVPSSTT
jgi:SAM-dependent methyltransferase